MTTLIQKMLIVSLLGLAGVRGVDGYRIYLNDKLLLQQYVGRPLKLESLALSEANAKDNLVIYYSHCGATGRGRSISIKDESGAVLKEWKFPDAPVKEGGQNIPAGDDKMVIPVREILAVQGKGQTMSLYYSSQQLPAGRMLTGVKKATKPVA